MASTTYDHSSSDHHASHAASRSRSVGEHAFIWIAWALAAAFWGATMTTMVGIVQALGHPAAQTVGGADFGGVAWLIIDVIGGVILLGGAMAYGSWMYAKRNRRLDPVTERATAELYDTVERQGGEDMTSISPEAERARREFR